MLDNYLSLNAKYKCDGFHCLVDIKASILRNLLKHRQIMKTMMLVARFFISICINI